MWNNSLIISILSRRKELLLIAVGILLGLGVSTIFFPRISDHGSSLVVPMDVFPEPGWRTPQTLDTKIVASTPFARYDEINILWT